MLLVMNLYMGVRQTNFPMYLNFSDMASWEVEKSFHK